MITKFQAVNALVGGELTQLSDGSFIYRSGQTPPTEEAIEAKLKELKADYDAKQYQRDRAEAYDPIPEQLDQIYHDMDGWKKRIKAVKDKYPKPT